MLRELALKRKIPIPFIEESIQEIQLKFYLKNGLDLYDPSMGYKFQTFYRAWASMFLLQERDKAIRYIDRTCVAGLPSFALYFDESVDDFSDEIIDDDRVSSWVESAKNALMHKPHLIPLLQACYEAAKLNKTVTYKEVMDALSVDAKTAKAYLVQMRTELCKAGFDKQSIFRRDDE